MDYISEMPFDIIWNINQFLDIKSMVKLSGTCKNLRQMYKQNEHLFFGMPQDYKYDLFDSQKQIIVQLIADSNSPSPSKNIFINAEMGTGKTAISILNALNYHLPCIIVSPTKAISAWIIEFENYFGKIDKKNPENNKVLVCSTGYEKHLNYFNDDNFSLDKNPFKFILTTNTRFLHNQYCNNYMIANIDYYANLVSNTHVKRDKFNILSVPNYLLILDEIHSIPNMLNFHLGFDKCLMLSATNIDSKHYDLKITPKFTHDTYPEITHKFDVLPKKDELIYGIHSENYEEQEKIDYIRKVIKKYKCNHLIVFIDLKDTLVTKFVNNLKDKMVRPVIKFVNKTPHSIEKFNNASKAILIAGYGMSTEGVNMRKCDYVIYFDFDTLGLHRSSQAIGRIRRNNSLYKNILCLFPLNNENPQMQMVLSRINWINFIEPDIIKEKLAKSRIQLIIDILNDNSYKISKLSNADIVKLFTYTNFGKFTSKDYTLDLLFILNLTNIY